MQVHRTSFMVEKDFKKEYVGASHLFYGRKKILEKNKQVHRTSFMVGKDFKKEYVGASHLFYGRKRFQKRIRRCIAPLLW